LIPLDHPTYFKSIQTRQHQVEQDQVGRSRTDRIECGISSKLELDVVTFLGQVVLEHFRDCWLIFDDEYPAFSHGGWSLALNLVRYFAFDSVEIRSENLSIDFVNLADVGSSRRA
jgi:hypothetical protein